MPCYIISYELAEGASAEPLIEAIKKYGTWAHITKTTWAVVTQQKAREIRDNLASKIPATCKIFIVKSGTEAAWRNAIAKTEWLKKYL